MPHHRKKHGQREPFNIRKAIIYAGVAGLMLVFTIVLIVPHATRQNISWTTALLLVVVLWLFSLFLGWLCLQSTRRKRKRRHSSREHVVDSASDEVN